MRKPAAAISAAMHLLFAIFLLTITVRSPSMKPAPERVHILAPLRPFIRPDIKKQGGGGQHDPLPPSRGRAPVIVTPRAFVPPTVARNEHPKLVMASSLIEMPAANIDSDAIGDPVAKAGIPSGGPGRFGGIGTGDHGGVGPGSGARQGSETRAPAPKLTRRPLLIYKVEPEYSDEARKAHWEGTVTLAIDVDALGRPVNIRVLHGLGLGLDEKAIAAVARWKFRPAVAGDRLVTAPATVEVTFHLL